MLHPEPPAASRLRPIHRPIPFVTLRVVTALILREMSSAYGRKPGGYLWAVLEPLGAILVLTWIFSFGFRHPALGTDFAMFYASGFLPFTLFLQLNSKISSSLKYSKSLLAYPRVTVIDVVVARFILALLLQLFVTCLILVGVRTLHETGTTLILPRILLGFTMAAALGLGIGTLNCVLLTAFPLYQTAWNLMSRPLVLVSGVIVMVESLPRSFQAYITWNPLAHAVAEVRAGFYFGYHPTYVDPGYVFLVSAIALAVGVLLTSRFHREALES